ncbi:MAG: 50S ribosomal protein L32 [Dehalococcoidales bacterium]|nr:MAG: 50S ribosomal protein L32 [Dehalococcoidales bacterium]
MPPQPKRKYAKARQGKRRSHIAASAPALITCSQCNSPKLPHHVCPTCGSYNGRDVTEIKSSKSRSS